MKVSEQPRKLGKAMSLTLKMIAVVQSAMYEMHHAMFQKIMKLRDREKWQREASRLMKIENYLIKRYNRDEL